MGAHFLRHKQVGINLVSENVKEFIEHLTVLDLFNKLNVISCLF